MKLDIREFGPGDLGTWADCAHALGPGYAELGRRPHANGCDGRPVAFLEAISVAPQARRSGVGRARVHHLSEVARAMGLRELGSDASIETLVSHHRACGFSEAERVVHVRMGL